jgi:hypothetical protein
MTKAFSNDVASHILTSALQVETLDFGSVTTHRYLAIGASAASIIHSTISLSMDSQGFSTLGDVQKTFETGENWLTFGKIMHHLLMLPLNIA